MEEEDQYIMRQEATFSEDDNDGNESSDDCYSEEEEDDCIIGDDKHIHNFGELKQHFVAILISIIAAIITHSHINGGYNAWKDELIKDWSALKHKLVETRSSSSNLDGKFPTISTTHSHAPSSNYYAPSLDGIPTSGGRIHAANFRRTRGLQFCPTNAVIATTKSNNKKKKKNLVEMEFILPLEPSVRVLHSYYLADALRLQSSMVYEDSKSNNAEVGYLGSYTADRILTEIDNALADTNGHDDDGLTIDQVKSIVKSYLPISMINVQHICLLHQYTLNKESGRSIRGTTKVYKQPHVSSFYRDKVSSQEVEETNNYQIAPASLTFTGYAAKFINLSPNDLKLYWDGGRIPSGHKAGQMHTVLVGTIRSMESIGTSSHPGHSFYVTPTYDKSTALQRWTITEDEAVIYYDPLAELSIDNQRVEMDKLHRQGKWTEKQLFNRHAWMVDRSFGRDYLVKTGRVWLANFPQPHLQFDDADATVDNEVAILDNNEAGLVDEDGHKIHMWQADFMGQTHTVETSSLYYNILPKTLDRLMKYDYTPNVEKKRLLEMKEYQSSTLKSGSSSKSSSKDTTTMSLTLKVLSCSPRVLEAKKFLSPVEVQHLIDLASGVKGDVVMEQSTVSGSNVNKKVRGGSKADARSSTGGWVHREQDVIVDTIFRRIADLLNIDEQLMRDIDQPISNSEGEDDQWLPTHNRIVEAMQLLRYEPGEEYSAHHDFTYPSIENRYQPKRYATILLYLTGEGDVVENGVRRSTSSNSINENDGLKGGATTFPRALTTDLHDGLKVKPNSGSAVLFYNVLPDGNMDDLSQHSGGKVEEGIKYVANVWIWDPIVN